MDTNVDRVGQMSIRWSPAAPAEERATLLGKLRAIKTRRRAAPRPNYDRARRAAEKRGAEVLAAPDDAKHGRATHVVRIYYRSLGGEVLCFDALLGRAAAAALVREHRQPDLRPLHVPGRDEAWQLSRCFGSDAIDAEMFPLTAPPALHPSRHGARRVVLPSQHPNPVEVIGADEASAAAERAA